MYCKNDDSFANLSEAEAGVGMMCSDGIPIKYCVSFLNANKQKPNIVFGSSGVSEQTFHHHVPLACFPPVWALVTRHRANLISGRGDMEREPVAITGSPGLRDQDKDAFPRSLEQEVAFTTENAIIQPNKDFYLGS